VVDQVSDSSFDHLRLSSEHSNHFHYLFHEVVVCRGLVRLHDRHDLTIDYGTALLLDALLKLLVRDRLVFWS